MLVIITSHPIQYQAPLWRELARNGIKFEVWFLTNHAVAASYDREFGTSFAWDVNLTEGYTHRFLPVAEGWTLRTFNGIKLNMDWAAEFKAAGATHVWVEGWRFRVLWEAVRAAKASGLQVWLRGENHDLAPESLLRRLWKRPLLRHFFKRVDHFLCIGSANRRFYLSYGVHASRLVSTPYCIDNARFAAAAGLARKERHAQRTQLGIAPDAFVFLFCGKLIPKKRPLDLVQAACIARASTPRPLHLLFAGDGELAPALRDAFTLPGCPPATITGFINQSKIPAIFAASDCLVLPSDFGETWGLVANEALACGLPVIVSDHCGCAEDLAAPLGAHHIYGCGDIPALARSFAAVISTPPSDSLLATIADRHSPMRTAEIANNLLKTPKP